MHFLFPDSEPKVFRFLILLLFVVVVFSTLDLVISFLVFPGSCLVIFFIQFLHMSSCEVILSLLLDVLLNKMKKGERFVRHADGVLKMSSLPFAVFLFC